MTERTLEGRTALVTGGGIVLLRAPAGAEVPLTGLDGAGGVARSRRDAGAVLGLEAAARTAPRLAGPGSGAALPTNGDRLAA